MCWYMVCNNLLLALGIIIMASFRYGMSIICVIVTMSFVLLGDSIFKRLLTVYPSNFDLISFQFCISGIKVQELKAIVKLNREILKGKRVILMVGTNNVTSKEAFEPIKGYYRSLVRFLKRLSCDVTIVEILPIPRCERVANVHSVLVQLKVRCG